MNFKDFYKVYTEQTRPIEPDWDKVSTLAHSIFKKFAQYISGEFDEIGCGIFMSPDGKLKIGPTAIGKSDVEIEIPDIPGMIMVAAVHTHPNQSAEFSEYDMEDGERAAQENGIGFMHYVIGLDDYSDGIVMNEEFFEPQ